MQTPFELPEDIVEALDSPTRSVSRAAVEALARRAIGLIFYRSFN